MPTAKENKEDEIDTQERVPNSKVPKGLKVLEKEARSLYLIAKKLDPDETLFPTKLAHDQWDEARGEVRDVQKKLAILKGQLGEIDGH